MSYVETEELQLLALPYQGNDLLMLVILPKENDGLSQIEGQLTNDNVTQWKSKLISREVNLAMPKFVMTDTLDLREVLSALGMTKAFELDIADFSGITSQEPLFISTARHIAYVDVNEEGTEAAAVTTELWLGMSVPEEPPVSFRADHPFLFMIQHRVTDSILFLGRVVSPQT
jgi:serpin B